MKLFPVFSLLLFSVWNLTEVFSIPIVLNEEPSLRLVGGAEATPHEFPWLVSLRWREGQFCEGVIINEESILTAASCAQLIIPFYLEIWAGLHYLDQNDTSLPFVQKRNPSMMVSHPQFPSGPRGLGHDLAILKLGAGNGFIFNEYVNSITIVPVGQILERMGTIAGWGSRTEEEITLSHELLKGEVEIKSDIECVASYAADFDSQTMLCTGQGQTGADFCNGELGGPLISDNGSGIKFLVGIASWGQGCGDPDFPSVYTEVSAFWDFINSNL